MNNDELVNENIIYEGEFKKLLNDWNSIFLF